MSPSSRSIPGTEELDRLYRSIGFALAQWQFIEAALAKLYVFLLHNDNGAAHSSFFAIENFYSKLEVVNAAAQSALRSPLLGEWDKLYKKLDSHRQVRNNLAHFAVIVRGELDNEKHVYYLQPTWFDISHLGDTTSPKYHFKDITNFGFNFEATSREVEALASKIGVQQSPPPAHHPQQ
jgi:hypothetical protein